MTKWDIYSKIGSDDDNDGRGRFQQKTVCVTDINLRAAGPQTFEEVCPEGREQSAFQN